MAFWSLEAALQQKSLQQICLQLTVCLSTRSISAVYESTVDLKGIDVYRYTLPSEALEAPAINPDNHCYCTDTVISKNCTVAGLLDVTSCRGLYHLWEIIFFPYILLSNNSGLEVFFLINCTYIIKLKKYLL